MKKADTINTFDQGLIMDLNPLVTPNDVLVNALNATLITFNGNENVLLNDMGNGRVETAYLPEGYVPLGTTSLGGIIYIVSYNPLSKKCLIGSFPSPERNLTTDEYSDLLQTLSSSEFVDNDTKEIIATVIKKQLSDFTLHSGDKYIVGAESLSDNFYNISELGEEISNVDLTLSTLDSNNRLVELTTSKKYDVTSGSESVKYDIYDGLISSDSSTDIDEYRSLVSSPYQVFSSKIAGNLYVVATLEVIETFTITYLCVAFDEDTSTYTLQFDVTTTPDNIFLTYIRLNDFGNTLDNTDIQVGDSESNLSTIASDPTIYFEREDDETTELSFNLLFKGDNIDGDTYFTVTPCMSYGIYTQLATTLYINLSLLGTGAIENTVWRYYKQESNLYLVWNLNVYPRDNLEVTSIIIYVSEYNNIDEEIPIVTVTNRSSYSGSYSNYIDFSSTFLENSLYFAKILVTYLNTTTNTEEYQYIYKVLYTNGVYNNTYINSTVQDFDTVSPELTYQANFTISESVTKTTESRSNSLISLSQTEGYIRGADIITFEGSATLNATIGFVNDYNTFTVDNSGLSISIDNQSSSASESVSVVSTSDLFNDTAYITSNPVVEIRETTDIPEDYLDFQDEFYSEVNGSDLTVTIELEGRTYNKISADSTYKSINVTNYIAPVIYDTTTAAQYGLTYVDGTGFSYGSVFPFVGLRGGGTDDDGTGNHLYWFGTKAISGGGTSVSDTLTVTHISTLINLDGDQRVVTSKNAPDTEMTSVLLNYYDFNYSIFPMAIIKYGDHQGGDVYDATLQRTGNVLHADWRGTSQVNDYTVCGPEDDYVVHYAEGSVAETTDLQFLLVLLCMYGQNGLIYMTDNYIAIKNEAGYIQVGNPNFWGYGREYVAGCLNLGNLVAGLLMQLYVRRSSQTLTGYAVNSVQYYNSLNELCITSFDYSISGLSTDDSLIYFNGTLMSEIRSNAELFGLDSTVNALNIATVIPDSTTYNYTYALTASAPSLLTDYLTAANNATLDTYVKTVDGSEIDVSNITITSSGVYGVTSSGELSSTTMALKIPTSITLTEEGEITAELANSSLNVSPDLYVKPSLFYWSASDEKLLLSSSYLLTCDRYHVQWCDSHSHDSYINYSNIKIFNEFNIVE